MAATETAPLLELRDIAVRYGAVVAVDGVDLALHRGEIVAVIGGNGAGKSSLIKVMSGAEEPSRGDMRIKGRTVRLDGPGDALSRGIATIYQDLALAPRLAIYQNVFLGAERVRNRLGILDKPRMMADAKDYLRRLGVEIEDMRRPVEGLSGGQRQAVAIARALRWNADLIVMDEPTAALGVTETAQVLGLIRRLRDEGRSVLLVSHDMHAVASLAGRVVVMRHGRKVADRAAAGLRPQDLAAMIELAADETLRAGPDRP